MEANMGEKQIKVSEVIISGQSDMSTLGKTEALYDKLNI